MGPSVCFLSSPDFSSSSHMSLLSISQTHQSQPHESLCLCLECIPPDPSMASSSLHSGLCSNISSLERISPCTQATVAHVPNQSPGPVSGCVYSIMVVLVILHSTSVGCCLLPHWTVKQAALFPAESQSPNKAWHTGGTQCLWDEGNLNA